MPAQKKTKPTIKGATKSAGAKKTPAPKAAAKPAVKADTGANQKGYETLRGMKDILPKDEKYWLAAYATASNIAQAYSYGYIETPIVENAKLFIRSIGKGTDVIEKEMYVFDDRDATKVCLRPEATASVVRAYIGHGMQSVPQPVKVWYQGPMFRHDRPQAGRYRQFHQFGCEVIGEKDPVVDAELITVAYNFLLDLGVESLVHINSIGNLEERQQYIIELVGYLRSKRAYLCEDCKIRINKNPLRVLDCKETGCQEVLEEAPQIIEWLSTESKDFFMKVLEYLDELHIPYMIQPKLVRGLDYYTDTVFELYAEQEESGAQSALGGGGRYDMLVEQLGGRAGTPGSGFSIGLERVVNVLKHKESAVTEDKKKMVRKGFFFAQLGGQARRSALRLIEELRRSHMRVGSNLCKNSLKTQLELADKMHASHTIILGQKEVQEGTVIVRDMDSGIQEIIDQKKLEKHLRKLLGEGSL
ncbi:MAG: histidine--tRNA ligase [Candidatus Magasanikbacteria bacterium]|nr:histidine--tRNA ligase [Candidatus Magasanikbacteria bacterium]